MTTYTGKNLYLKFGSTELAADYRTFTPTYQTGLEDASAGSDTGVTRLATLFDGNASATFRSIAGGTATWSALAPQTSGTLEWGPEGTASSKPKYTVTAIVESRSETLAYAGVTEWNITWQFSDNGGVTESSY